MGFSAGVMIINGVRQMIARMIERESSNGVTRYNAIEWSDPATGERRTSCNCPGWANRRTCKHVVELEGNANIGILTSDTLARPRQITATPKAVTIRDGNRELRGFMFGD